MQRDWGFEGGLRARDDAALLPLRRRAAEACRAVYAELGLASFSDEDVEACVQAHGSLDVPLLPPALVPDAGAAIDERGIGGIDVVRALAATGYEIEAERVLEMLRQRLLGDYLQTAAIFDEDVRVQSNLSDPNDYAGPGTGYRMGAERRAQVARVRQERTQDELLADQVGAAGCLELRELGPAAAARAPGRGRDRRLAGVRGRRLADAGRADGGRGAAPGAGGAGGGGRAGAHRAGAALASTSA